MKHEYTEQAKTLTCASHEAMQAGDWVKARQLMDEAIADSPKHPFIWFQKGMMLNELDENEEAITCIRKAIEIDSSKYKYWYGLGLVQSDMGNEQEAYKCYEESIKLEPTCGVYATMSLRQAEINNGIEALRLAGLAIELDPRDEGAQDALEEAQKLTDATSPS